MEPLLKSPAFYGGYPARIGGGRDQRHALKSNEASVVGAESGFQVSTAALHGKCAWCGTRHALNTKSVLSGRGSNSSHSKDSYSHNTLLCGRDKDDKQSWNRNAMWEACLHSGKELRVHRELFLVYR
jgi:hypothetical protein